MVDLALIREALLDPTISCFPDFTKAVGEACDELERLRTATGEEGRTFMQALVDDASREKQRRTLAETRAQRLETALRAMLTNYGPPDSVAPLCQYPDWHPIMQARRALSASTGGSDG
ncbi:hypothetical protein [Shinella pollutisoli]|uniref:Uncharacterized protein n=1 Tax=Shinella pollutisoli TaxID=2250594 RepID=A0ABV7DJ67_9HYPH|nr:hypothetical protein [Shinella pollutisoli]